MREMYDSTNPEDIPRNAEMVAYYVDGAYTWPQEWLDMFPNAIKVAISAIGVKSANVGDAEEGCIWPPENVVDWVLQARRDGFDPTVYTNQLNDWIWVAAEFTYRGVAHPHWWVARYDGVPTIPDGAVAKQYKHPPQIGLHYDLSVVADHWPGVDKNLEENDMAFGIPNMVQWEPGTEKWGVLAIPPVGESLSVGGSGQAWLHLRCPNRPTTILGVWFVHYDGYIIETLEEFQLPQDSYWHEQLPEGCSQVSVLYTAEVPIAATVETRA